MFRNISWDACFSPKLMLRHFATKASGCTSVPLLRVIPWLPTAASAAAGVVGAGLRAGVPGATSYPGSAPLYRCPLYSGTGQHSGLVTRSAVLGGMVIRLPHTLPTSRGRTRGSACWGRSNSRSGTPALPGWRRRMLFAHEFDGQVEAARSGRDRFRRVVAAESRGVAVAQLVVWLASQTDEHSLFSQFDSTAGGALHGDTSQAQAGRLSSPEGRRHYLLEIPGADPADAAGGQPGLSWRCGPTRGLRAGAFVVSPRPASG